MKISQKTIAKEAGVSRGTVDRVLHGKPNVKIETRERVLSAIEKLGYTPNEAGRALALSSREYTVCVALPDNPFFTEVKRGIAAAEKEFRSYNITVTTVTTNGMSGASLTEKLNAKEYSAYALAVADMPEMQEFIKKKREKGIPVITFNSDVKDSGRLCFVGQDLYKSGRIAASLMIKMLSPSEKIGRILIVTGSRRYLAHREREKGFSDALSALGNRFEIAATVETEDEAELTYIRVKEALKSNGKIDGIYMASGHAEGLANAIREDGGRYRTVVNDLLPVTEKAIREGLFDFTILQSQIGRAHV